MPTPLAYVMKETKQPGEKLMDVAKGLTDVDKATLKDWARVEMDLLGVEITEAKTSD